MTRARTMISSAVATLVVVAVSGGAATTQAATVRSLDHGRTTAVLLTHAETVTAARIGAGNLINAIAGNHWGVTLESDSRYADRGHLRSDTIREWNDVTGQQLVAEAAAHPGGRVALGYTPSTPGRPLWVQQLW